MKFLIGIITYNRINYLKNLITTWEATRSKSDKWIFIVADDRSTDGSIEYIEGLSFDKSVIIKNIILNKRDGVHHQVNQVLKYASSIDFDIGFMVEDDAYFKRPGWDILYAKAIKLSGYDHMCFFDGDSCLKLRGTRCSKAKKIVINKKKIQCEINNCFNTFGCFWTFTHRVIKKVGYFDLQHFGLTGSGHTDYSKRCCQARFNNYDPFFDALNSQNYVGTICDNYIQSCCGEEPGLIEKASTYNIPTYKYNTIARNDRMYVPYNELPYDMNRKDKIR